MSVNLYPIIVFHNVASSKSCSEFVKISSGMGFKTLIITNAQGSAAQKGLAAAQKIAIKNNLNFMVLGGLEDIIELFNPEELILVAPTPYGDINLTSDVVQGLKDKKWIAVFGGNDPGLSRKDLTKGTKIVQIPAGDIGSLGILTLGLAILTGKFGFIRRNE